MVARPRRHGASRSASAQLLTGSLTSADQFKVDRSADLRRDAAEARPAGAAEPRHRLPDHHQLQARQAACDGGGPLGAGMAEGEHGRQRRLHGRDLQAGRAGDPAPQRGVESRHRRTSRRSSSASSSRRCRSRRRAPISSSGATPTSSSTCRRTTPPRSRAKGKLKVISTPQFNAMTLHLVQQPDAALRQGRGAPRDRLCAALRRHVQGRAVRPRRAALRRDLAGRQAAERRLPDPAAGEARPRQGEGASEGGRACPTASRPPSASMSARPRPPSRWRRCCKESLAKIGIKVEIQKLPDAQMSTQISEKKLPFFTEGVVAWLPSNDYFYRNFYTGNQRWNYSSINNPELVEIAQKARFEQDKAKYEDDGQGAERASTSTQMPQIPLWQPNQDAVMAAVDRRLRLPVPPAGRLPRPQPQVDGERHDWRPLAATAGRAGRRLPVVAAGAVRRARLHLPADARAAGRSGGVLRLRPQCRQGGDRGDPQADGARQAGAGAARAAISATSARAISAAR